MACSYSNSLAVQKLTNIMRMNILHRERDYTSAHLEICWAEYFYAFNFLETLDETADQDDLMLVYVF